jgi:hypothetical protein
MARRNLAVLSITAWAVFACAPREGTAYVFAANFYQAPVSVRIGEEPRPVFFTAALACREISPLVPARVTGDFPVAYAPSAAPAGRDAWQRLPRELADALCPVRFGAITAVIIDARGFIRAATLADDPRPGARVCFLNASTAGLVSLSLCVPEDKAFPVFWTNRLKPGAATRFRSVVPGRYRLDAVFTARPEAPGGKGEMGGRNGPPGTISLSTDLACEESSYWLLYGCGQDGKIVLGTRLLANRERDRLVAPGDGR